MPSMDVALARLRDLRTPSLSVHTQRIVLAVSAVAFVVAGYFAFQALPPIESGRVWWVIVVIGLVGAPANLALNAEEFHAIGKLVRVPLGWMRRMRVSVVAAAANLLPLPGSLVVRGRDLHKSGASAKDIGVASGVAGVAWIGANGLVAGVGLLVASDAVAIGVGAAAIGLLVWCVLGVWYHRSKPDLTGALLYTLGVEAVSVFVGGIRLYAVIWWLGYDVDLGQALALTASGLAIAAAGFIPSGLGVRELASVAIGPLVGLPASVSFAAAAVSRVIDLVALAPFSIALLLHPEELAPDDDLDGVVDPSDENALS